jgi:hypothetical protein
MLCGRFLPASGSDKAEPSAKKPATSPFESRLLEIAKSYTEYGRVDDQFRWAPGMCRPPNPAEARFSASKDAKTHGDKLYSIFASQRDSYVKLSDKANAVGQAVVKQSWIPKEVADTKEPLQPVVRRVGPGRSTKGQRELFDRFLPYARKDGRLYHADRQAELFIMFKMDPKTPDTDQGWVYGTVTADGKKVTSAGRVESCMRCHQKATHDRLFGLPEKKDQKDAKDLKDRVARFVTSLVF